MMGQSGSTRAGIHWDPVRHPGPSIYLYTKMLQFLLWPVLVLMLEATPACSCVFTTKGIPEVPTKHCEAVHFVPVLLDRDPPGPPHHLPPWPLSTSASQTGSWSPLGLVRNFCHGWGASSAGIIVSHCL